MDLLCISNIVKFLLKVDRGRDRKPNSVVLMVGSAPNVGLWVVVTWGKKSCLGPAEISSCVLLFKFKDWGRRVSLTFHLFVADVNRGSEDFRCKKVGAKFSGVASCVSWTCFGVWGESGKL